ncbi:cytidylyltransferase domain-containing protein [Zavarzinia sp. CC-PAN008]|uniref:cytidylyltransferase domain-containing protein n=1 Tax=Zavarzinia sp. CC-PAN008 TaxID=3243332 RepID=UPI003F7473A9
MTTAIIIQARLGSTRLPGKVLMDLGGRSVLAWVLERALAATLADVVVCAVPDKAADDPVAAEALACGAQVHRGSESDVLDRYVGAARQVAADVVVRITSDCPLADPALIDALIRFRAERGLDYATNNAPPTYPHGLDAEIMTRAALEAAGQEARLPSEREHVSPWIRTHPALAKGNLPGPGGPDVALRWTLDHADDLAMLRALARHMPLGPAAHAWRVPLAIVHAHPEIGRMNQGHDRLEGLKASIAAEGGAADRAAAAWGSL